MTTTTGNMKLKKPEVSVTSGNTWALNLNDSSSLIDSHDHSNGKGVRISQTGILFSDTFSFNDKGGEDVAFVSFTAQTADPSAGSLYFKGNDLYVRTLSGGVVQLTASGGFNSALVGGIGGDYTLSSASLDFDSVNEWYTFYKSPTELSKVRVGAISIHRDDENPLNEAGVTLQAPLALASAYTVTLPPAAPSVTSVMYVASNGISTFTPPTDAIPLPIGTTAERPTGQAAMVRFNTDTGFLEFHDGAVWGQAGFKDDAGEAFELVSRDSTGVVRSSASVDAVKLPVGTTAQRPTPETGMIRYNTDTSTVEVRNGTIWKQLNTSDVSGSTLGDLNNVAVGVDSPDDGQALVYNATSGLWEAGNSVLPLQPTATTSGTLATQTPTLASSAFRNLINQNTHVSSDWEVRNQSTQALVFSSYDDASNLVSITTTTLPLNTVYEYRVRHTDENGDSTWSAYQAFTIPADQVLTPTVDDPAGASTIYKGQEFTSSAFDTLVQPTSDTHLHSDWEVRKVSDDTLIDSSYDDTVNKTTWTPDLSAIGDMSIKVRVRHNGTTLGDSVWSDYVSYNFIATIIFEKYVDGLADSATFDTAKYRQHFGVSVAEVFGGYYRATPTPDVAESFKMASDGASLAWSKRFTQAGSDNTIFSFGGVSDGNYVVNGGGEATTQTLPMLTIQNASTGASVFAKSDSNSSSTGYMYGACFTSDSDVVAVGYKNQTSEHTNTQLCAIKVDPTTPTISWQKGFYVSGEGDGQLYGCTQTGNGRVVGCGTWHDGTASRACVVVLDNANGNLLNNRLLYQVNAAQFYTVQKDNNDNDDVFLAGYVNMASVSNVAVGLIASYDTLNGTINWTRATKAANNTNTSIAYRQTQDTTRVFATVQQSTEADYVIAVNKSDGSKQWTARATNISVVIQDVKLIGSELIVTGQRTDISPTQSFVASLNPSTGATNYVKEASYTYANYLYEIHQTPTGYTLCGKYQEGGTVDAAAIIKNPDQSADFSDITGTWTFETFTSFEPADSITDTSKTWTATSPNFTDYSPTVADTSYTTNDLV